MKPHPFNAKDFAIGVLSITAVILFTGLVILSNVSPQLAFAGGQGGNTGDYVVSTARLDDLTELVFVTDTTAQEMNMYGFIPARGSIDLVQKFDLRALEALNQPPRDDDDRGDRNERRNR